LGFPPGGTEEAPVVSYLGFPRLHFCGSFQADPSTVNNDPYHFDMAAFRPGWQQPGAGATKGWWNPDGTAAWRLSGCTVRSVGYADGSVADEPWDDPVIGMPVNSATERVAAKLVDLDPEQQMVSEIWGLQVELGDLGRPNAFSGEFEVAAFADIWVRFPAGQPDSFFSATYQSVLTALDWSDQIDSRLLQELGGAQQLSIKFTVDGFDDDRDSPRFTLGRISGAIGPYAEGEPHHLVAARLMRPPATAPVLNFAPFRIDGDRLLVDLANSLPTTAVGGPQQDVGRLEVALLPAGAPPVAIGVVNYLSPGWYEDRAGIQAFTLDAEQVRLAAQSPVGIVRRTRERVETLLSEDTNGTFVRADRFVFRMDPGVPATTTLYATRFGARAAGQRIDLVADNTVMEQQVTQGVGHGPPVGVPTDALTFPDHVTTGPDGTADVTLEGSDPGNRRGYIDGQVYGVRFDWHGVDLSAYGPDTMNLLSVLLWTAYEVPAEPTWMDDVHAMLHQYAELYPVMRRVLDLDDYHSVVENADSLQYVFSRPVTDPNYMPVVRDLSTAKRETILAWLKDPHPRYMRTTTVEDLRRALQQAIELEHSTIPPYLTALFSIKDGHNRAVAEIIRSVVIEEMLHMALACNLLNAIGGEPQIGRLGFVPQYPSKLPGGLRPDLTVSLRKASIEQIHRVFMGIEEPEETLHPRARHALTIGWFYGQIESGLKALHEQDPGLFRLGDPARQVVGWRGPGELFAVDSLETAMKAIREITDQGEGTSPINPADGYDEIAHFYRFEEIVRGRRIVLTPDGYSFTGPEVRFDPDGVWPMIDDPNPSKLPDGSLVRRRSDEVDDLYWSLLAVLHEAFNGRPDRLNGAIELMFSLEVAAKKLVQTPIAPGAQQTAGPAFRDPRPLPASAELPTDPSTRRKPLTMKGQPAPH
jgi:rubrerythrin